jgi:predicted HTH domain antitoxin
MSVICGTIRPEQWPDAGDDIMTTISFDVPEDSLRTMAATPEDFALAVRLAAAMFWYGRRELTLGSAAMLAGMSQAEFMHALKEARQDTFQIGLDDFDRELAFLAERHTGNKAG